MEQQVAQVTQVTQAPDAPALNKVGRKSGGNGPRAAVARTNRGTKLAMLKGAAPILGVTYSALRAAARRGEFPITRIGNRDYAAWAHLDRWIEAKTETAVA